MLHQPTWQDNRFFEEMATIVLDVMDPTGNNGALAW
jgi:hypothetical protein